MPPSLLAASGTGDPRTVAAIVALAVTAGYIVACIQWPLAACRWCKGKGKFRSPSGKAWRKCRHCKGFGARIRFGRKVWSHLTRVHEKGRK